MRRRHAVGLLLVAGVAGVGARLLLDGGDPPPAASGAANAIGIIDGYQLYGVDGAETGVPGLGSEKLLLNFWATWCPPCRHELPLLEQVHVSGSRSVVALAVDEQPAVAQFLQDTPLGMPVVIAGLTGGVQLASELGNATSAMPYTVLIEKSGQIAASKIGPFANVEEIEAFAA